MAYRHDYVDELHRLKQETTRLIGAQAEEWRDASSKKANDVAADVKAFLSDLRDAIALDEKEIERAFTGRAATALMTALAVGVVIGWVLRKKP